VRGRCLRRNRAAIRIVEGAAVLMFAAVACAAEPVSAANICSDASIASSATGSSAVLSPCAVTAGTLLVESLYYQNASQVGGTALAAYPLVRLRLGIAPRTDIVLEPPSQIAESGLHGAGLYPSSHSGYGLEHTFAQSARAAWGAALEVVPPASLYAPSETQPKYRLDVATKYRVNRRLALKGTVGASSSHSAGFGTILPATAVGGELAPDARTVFSADLGARRVTHRATAQSFADFSLTRTLDHKLAWNVGVGTAFNPVANAKAHYLSTGLAFRP
jgi:hypothetical protein